MQSERTKEPDLASFPKRAFRRSEISLTAKGEVRAVINRSPLPGFEAAIFSSLIPKKPLRYRTLVPGRVTLMSNLLQRRVFGSKVSPPSGR